MINWEITFNTEPLTKENNQIKKDKSITRLLISETNDYKEAYFMTIISSADYLANTDAKPENNTYLKQQDNFEGLIIYHNLKGDYVAGKKFGKMQNELDKQLSLSPVKDRKVSIAVPDNCREIYIYQIMGYNCVDVGSNFVYCQSTYSNYVGSQTICGTGHQTDPWQGNPWGGGSGSNNSNLSRDIIDSLQGYPCAQSILEQIPLLKNNIADSIKSTFLGNCTYTMRFVANDALKNSSTDGETKSKYIMNNGINFDDGYTVVSRIGLNPDILNNATKEYILVTMYHEALHAFLDAEKDRLGFTEFKIKYPEVNPLFINGPNGSIDISKAVFIDGHSDMAKKFLNSLKTSIISFNNAFDEKRALALAKTGITTLSQEEKNINAEERDTKNGTYNGTKCL